MLITDYPPRLYRLFPDFHTYISHIQTNVNGVSRRMSIGRLVIKIIRSGGGQQATLPITAGYFSRVSRPFAIYDRVENLARPVSKAELAGAAERSDGEE